MPSAVTVAPSLSKLPPCGTICAFTRPTIPGSGDDAGGVTAGALSNAGDPVGEGDEEGESGLRVEIVLSMGGFIPFEVNPQRGPDGSGSAQPQHDPAAIGKADADALLGTHRIIDRIMVGKIVGVADLEAVISATGDRRELPPQIVHQLVGDARIDLVIVVPRIIVAAIDRPVVAHDLVDALLARSEDVEPEQHGPQTVLLAHMVGA